MKNKFEIFFNEQSIYYEELLSYLNGKNLYYSLYDLQVSQYHHFSDNSLLLNLYYSVETIVYKVFITAGAIENIITNVPALLLNASGLLNQYEEFANDSYQEYCKRIEIISFQEFHNRLINKLIEDAHKNIKQTPFSAFLDIGNEPNYRIKPNLLDKFFKIRMYGSLNEETFAHYTSVDEIEPSNKLILDWYAFDINELLSLADTAILINPHTQDKFSDFSIKKMLLYPPLREKLQRANQIFDATKKELSAATKEKLITFVNALSLPNEGQAILDFHNYYLSLSLVEKNILDKQLLQFNAVSTPIEFGILYNQLLESKGCSGTTITMLRNFVSIKWPNSNFLQNQVFFNNNTMNPHHQANTGQLNSVHSSKMEI